MMVSNTIGCACSVLFLILASVWIPIIGPFLSLITPLPFLFYTSKLGSGRGLKLVLVTLFIVGLAVKLTGHPQLILVSIEFGIAGLILSDIFKRDLTFGLTIFWGTLLTLFVGTFFLFLMGLSEGKGPFELLLYYLQTNLDRSIGLYETRELDEATLVQLEEYAALLKEVISRIYPALLIVGSGLIIWLNVIISKPLFLNKGVKYPDLGRSDRWYAPEHMVWGVIAAGFSLLLPVEGLKFIALNTLIVLSVIYIFHGVSIVMFFFNKYNIPVWARAGVYLLILVQQIFLAVLALLGLFDQWVDFRKIHKKENEDL